MKVSQKISIYKPSLKIASYDFLAKVVLLGDSGVGKTNILLRFSDDNYIQSHIATLGVDFKIKTIVVDQTTLKLSIWDTAGQERFKTITNTFYKGAAGIFLVYAINDRNSFTNIFKWMQQVNQYASKDICKILIGSKCDIQEERVVTKQEGEQLASSYDIPFMEVSAKENINIQEMFQSIGQIIIKNISEQDKLIQQPPPLPEDPGRREGICCTIF